MSAYSIFKNALKTEYFPVMIGKIVTRIREPGLKERIRRAKTWAEKEALPLSEIL